MSINQTFNSYKHRMRLDEMYYTEIEMEWMKEILRDKEEYIKKLEEENKNLKEIRDNREEKIADLEIEICKLKEERDDFMLKYSKAVEEKIVETNNLCAERNKLGEENRKLKLHIEAKDKAYTALLKDYEELKEDNKRLKAEIWEWLNAIRQKI